MLSYWQWSASDLLSNATRGVLAEYLVARALGASEAVRAEWDSFDIMTENGIRVEVKSSAYLQSWNQKQLSRIVFSTRPTHAWDAETNTLSEERKRQADVYVFCLLHHNDKATVDPLDLSQWSFFVISTEQLNASIGDQKSIGLRALKKIGAKEVDYNGIAAAVQSTFA